MELKITYTHQVFNLPGKNIRFIINKYYKISYTKNDIEYQWSKIIKDENPIETDLYNKLSVHFKNSKPGTIFWTNKPSKLLFEITQENIDKSLTEIYEIISNECLHKWPLLHHDAFCRFLKRTNFIYFKHLQHFI